MGYVAAYCLVGYALSYKKKRSEKREKYRLSLLFKIRAVYCILTKIRNVLFSSIINHFILAQGSFSGSSLLPNAIHLIIEFEKYIYSNKWQYCIGKLNFEGLKSLI